VYTLKINNDSTFELTQKYTDVSPRCKGKWTILSEDSIRLKCFDEDNMINQISTGYMEEREKTVIILTSKKTSF
jgi:hypothetical protein